jgi:RNA polymerase sigma-70 factor (ECF subfamily)
VLPDVTSVLLARIRAGDQGALDDLCARYRPRLYRWATGRVPRGARGAIDTEDIVQDTLIKALRRLHDFEVRHEGALQAYLRQAILNRIRDEARRVAARSDPSTIDSQIAGADPSPIDEAVGRDYAERYEAALQRLRQDEREAIVLRVEFNYSYQEVAEAMNKPSADAARMAISRALLRLSAEMRAERNDEETRP